MVFGLFTVRGPEACTIYYSSRTRLETLRATLLELVFFDGVNAGLSIVRADSDGMAVCRICCKALGYVEHFCPLMSTQILHTVVSQPDIQLDPRPFSPRNSLTYFAGLGPGVRG